MDQASLSELIDVSRAVGVNPEYVQAAGGNTSVKSPDGRTMAIKASGTSLTAMSQTVGWVELDIAFVLNLLTRDDLAQMPVKEREAAVLDHLQRAAVGGQGRPSVESALHAMLGRVVVHTHAVAANAVNCGEGEAALAKLVKTGENPPLWVPYTDPGWRLAVEVHAAAQAYQKRYGAVPAVIFMENHGVLVAGEDAKTCMALHDDWVARCEQYCTPVAPAITGTASISSIDLRKAMAELRRAYREVFGATGFLRFSENPELVSVAHNGTAELMAAGSLSPDHIVYTGARAVVVDSLGELGGAVKAALAEKAPPRVAVVRGLGVFLFAADPAKLDAAEALAVAGARIMRLAAGRGGARNLSAESAGFIINWEAEHYRAKMMGGGQAQLAGRVALVTGAASGLGCGIAQGLVEAGAAVAFADIDEKGAQATAAESADPKRAMAVRMDVTSEQSVAETFDRLVKHWGGVDVLVCAAGIAPPYELVDLPVDKWRLALEVNLTGYFLAARETARIMIGQDAGGAMVMVSSKSGLDASKANSAYNATKAGELHLMRGWALELGKHGIRVNAVAPGNVFEGSKIWNPEYIKTAAKKKGIQPEEVIPYYTALTALNREIKRSDVAAAIAFLCSDAARCITGQTLVVDSGQVMVR